MEKLTAVFKEYGIRVVSLEARNDSKYAVSLVLKTMKGDEFTDVLDKVTKMAAALSYEVKGLGPYHVMGTETGTSLVFEINFDR